MASTNKALLDDDLLDELKTNGAKEAASSFSSSATTPSTSSSTPGSALAEVGFKAQPNPMSSLFQSTYHFSFYLDTDILANQGQGNEFVIAETGLTGMNIQNVEIDTFVGPNIRSRNANATSLTIKIYEPLGAALPDLLFQAAVHMNIRNYLKAPWFLRLKLHGYDDNGKSQTIGDGWKWQLVLTDVQSQISENGTLHTITAMPLSEVALNNQYCIFPNMTQVGGATVGEALNHAITSLNDSMKHQYGDTHPPFIEYAIEDRAYPYDTKAGVARPFDHKIVADSPQDSNQSTSIDYTKQTAHFPPGTDLPAAVDQLMSRCESAVKIARISRDVPPANGPDNETDVRDVSSLMHRIDTKVEYLSYNTVLNDYCKKITYVVKPYCSLRLLTSMGRAQSFDREKTLNARKAAFATSKMFLNKQYDYMFTGLNTEVEKFDITTNFRWAVQVPFLQRAFLGTPARVDNAAAALDLQRQLVQSNTDKDTAAEELEKAQALQPGEDPKDAATAKKRQDQIAAAQKKYDDAKTKSDTLAVASGRLTDQVNAAADASAARRPAPKGRITNGEDDIYENTQSVNNVAKAGYGGAGANNTSYLPIALFKDPDDPSSSTRTSTSTDNNPNKGVYGALLNQLYGSFDGNLQNIELEIRGDPYWLGPGSTGVIYDDISTVTRPNFSNGEHMFIFRFKLPQGFDDSSGGPVVPKTETSGVASSSSGDASSKVTGGSSNIFTGFYAVIQVTNHFREGAFKQTLNAVRIQGWSYENIIEGRPGALDEDANYVSTPAPTASPTSNSYKPGATTSSAGSRSSGTPRGTRNNNPANLVDGAFTQRQPGYTGSDGRFATFDTVDNGIKAQETLLEHNYLTSPTTVANVIYRYAKPASAGGDNSDASYHNYVNSVQNTLGKSNITSADTSALAAAMRKFESPGSR